MRSALTFRLLAAPLSKKTLRAFRRDAGWAAGDGDTLDAQHPRGRVQWVTVEHGKDTIGIARLEMAPPEFCYLADLIILSAHHGEGVGHWFLQNIERYCAQAGIRRLLLQPVDKSKGFYEKMQFVADPYVASFLKKELNPFQRRVFAHRADAGSRVPSQV
jgi:GNAT superfamily N-acetyltransferase